MNPKELTADRGKQYGKPIEHFAATQELNAVWARHFDKMGPTGKTKEERAAVRHAVYFILDKLVRACTSPKKSDHWDDVAGYARTVQLALDLLPKDDHEPSH